MFDQLEPLTITPLFDSAEGDNISNEHYCLIILRSLQKILPPEFFEQKETVEATCAHQKNKLRQFIPLVTCSETCSVSGTLSFFVLSKHRPNSFKFFFEMISSWLTPGRRLNVTLAYAADFQLSHLGEGIYTICEIVVRVSNLAELEEIRRNFPIIKSEIAIGIHSEFYAQRILEIKGVSADDKTSLVQRFIAFLVQRFPHVYDTDIFTEMQYVLVTCHDDFKAARHHRHLSRIISVQYLFRKALREAINKNAQRRHLSLKIFRAHIRTSTGRKRVLCLVVGVNFFRDQETFGEKHLLKAVQHYIPSSSSVEHSFLINKTGSENICIAYLELEKQDGSDFTQAEIRHLRHELPAKIKNRVEYRLHPVFMPRNEEEVMRNMLILTNQLKYVRDIPQMMIMFDEQAQAHLYFTIIVARVLKPESQSIADLFKHSTTTADYFHDRTKITGYIRKKYAKEATVFRLRLSKDHFLRADHSIDLYKARQTVVNEISKVIGEIRDYNGGMISKQHELLLSIRRLLAEVKDYDELLLENFFYSLAPVVVRAVIDPKAFRTLFLMLHEGIKEYKHEAGYYLKSYKDPYNLFILVIIEDLHVKEALKRAIGELAIPSMELAYAHVKTPSSIYLGYICCTHDLQKREQVFQTIEQTLKEKFLN